MLDQIERFAPGLRDRIVDRDDPTTADLPPTTPTTSAATSSPGPTTPLQTLIRPRFTLDPYPTGTPGIFICSAATPPGPGAHGMNGYNAAQSVLRQLRQNSPDD